jgi:glutamate-ammonia-ligase adenylyltransferase
VRRLNGLVARVARVFHARVKSTVLAQAVAAGPDPRRAEQQLVALRAGPAAPLLRNLDAEQARVLVAVLAGSQVLGEQLLIHADWLGRVLEVDRLHYPRQESGLRREVNGWLEPALANREYSRAFDELRLFKQRELLRIAARDLARFGTVTEITRELADVADVCLDGVFRLCRQQLIERFGQPWHQDASGDWQPTEFCVLGMGKLGGQELNYSSDVDVLFVYSEEGHVFKEPPRNEGLSGRGLSNHQFHKRLGEAFVAEVGRLTPAGMLYRIDLRLRPEGPTGPLARSLAGYENYYAQWGQTWERMMLIKTRRVAGDAVVAGEFLEMVQPFRFPRSLGDQALRDIATMKQRIEKEVLKAGEADRNVKLGRGGIREVEFVAQSLQILNVGRHPFLSDTQTIPTLQKLVRYKLLPAAGAEALVAAYEFLRDVEHRLQMEANLQTHTLPTERRARERLAALMGFSSLRAFEGALNVHRRAVREAYESVLAAGAPEATPGLPAEFQGCESEWEAVFAAHSFRDPGKALRLASVFVQGPGFGHVSSRTHDFARQLLARLLALCPRSGQPEPPPMAEGGESGDPSASRLSDPDRVLARLDTFIQAYGARALLFETWASSPSLFQLLVLLFDRSEFLAEAAIRTPDLVDELEQSGRLRRSKTVDQTLADLRHGLEDPDQRLWLRRYHQAELMRIGLRDILGLAGIEQSHVELSTLAEACLRYALEAVLLKHRLPATALAIIGLGKLGGAELNYGSDLDVVFVAHDKTRQLPAVQRVAVELIELLASQTELGVAFVLDARLRPDGEKGLLVNTLGSYEEYYRQRAQLWELQALSRSRWVAGHSDLGRRFEQMAARLTHCGQPDAALAAQAADWMQQIARMRSRIEKERTPPGQEALAIKTGAGGLVDAEFIAQALCLAHGWPEPNTLRALRLARERGALPEPEADLLIENYRKLRRVEAILRRWSYAGETTLPDDPAPLYRVAVRCGFPNAEAFMGAVTRCREHIRSVYLTVFGAA